MMTELSPGVFHEFLKGNVERVLRGNNLIAMVLKCTFL